VNRCPSNRGQGTENREQRTPAPAPRPGHLSIGDPMIRGFSLVLCGAIASCGTDRSSPADSGPDGTGGDSGIPPPGANCDDAAAPPQCGYLQDLPDGAPPPDGGGLPPMFQRCVARRAAVQCSGAGGGVACTSDDPTHCRGADPAACQNECCGDEYGIGCSGMGSYEPAGCRREHDPFCPAAASVIVNITRAPTHSEQRAGTRTARSRHSPFPVPCSLFSVVRA
jgi:hypothetical protein